MRRPEYLEDAGLSSRDSQPVVLATEAVNADELKRSRFQSVLQEEQDVEVCVLCLQGHSRCVINKLHVVFIIDALWQFSRLGSTQESRDLAKEEA